MEIYESGENYLETIYLLQKEQNSVRSIDIIEKLGYSKSSVSRAVNTLKSKGFINIDENGFINFTEKGKSHVENIYERHKVLTRMLEMLGVDKKTAENDACRMEHVISETTFEKIKEHISKE